MSLDIRTQLYSAVVNAPFDPANQRYGSFNLETKAFQLRNILTPRPWVNVLSNGSYGAVISNFGGGFSWVGNSQLQRLTRWEQDLVLDQYGRYIYVFDVNSGETLSTTFAPTRQLARSEEVVYGLGYSQYRREFEFCATEHTVFVPLQGDHEHWIVTLTNTDASARDFRLGGYLEWFLGNQGEWHREFHRLFVSLDASQATLYAWKRRGLDEGTRIAPEAAAVGYFNIQGLNDLKLFTDKAQFVGRAGDLSKPEAIVADTDPRVTHRWDDPIAGFVAPISLAAGESITFVVTLGMEPTQDDVDQVTGLATPQTILQRFEEVKAHYLARNGQLQLSTDNQFFDLLNNGWLPHQAETGRILARSAYFQQGGAYGYRDQLQDSLAYLDTEPELTFKQIILHAEAMFSDGGVRHWWHPGTKIVAESHHSDTCLWLAFATLEYLDETADFASLSTTCRYLDRETREFGSEGSLLEHCLRGIDRSLARQSERGLPLIGGGDWNDGLSHAGIDGKGESVWLAMFLFQILNRFADVLNHLGDAARATQYRSRAVDLQAAVEKYGWDGRWYIAGTSDNGAPFGSASKAEGSIFLNPQTWAILSGIGDCERTELAMEEVRRQLVKPYGALLLTPAYRNVDPYVGYITRYAPGMRENGGVYSHASTWAIQAFAKLGEMKTAFELYQAMMPTRCLDNVDGYEAEPFVMPGNVDGPDSPYEGRAGWTWYTGSAAWMRRTALNWIVGIRPTLDGLLIDHQPVPELGSITLTRKFRGDTFDISIEPGSRHRLLVDGIEVTGKVIPASGQNRHRTIQLIAI